MTTIQEMTARVRAEYLEMAGMRLKAEQVRRLCGLDRTMCQQVLDGLVNTKLLCVKPDVNSQHRSPMLNKPSTNGETAPTKPSALLFGACLRATVWRREVSPFVDGLPPAANGRVDGRSTVS